MENDEAYRTFNMGIGMAVVVSPEDVDRLMNDESLAQFQPVVIGEITAGSGVVDMKY